MKTKFKDNIIGFSVIGVITLWLLTLIVAVYKAENTAAAGDTFGIINTLFSGLAFVGLIWTIRQQSDQLKIQQEELKLTRDEVINSTIELKGQKQALELQNVQRMIELKYNAYYKSIEFFNFGGLLGIEAFNSLEPDDVFKVADQLKGLYFQLFTIYSFVQESEISTLERSVFITMIIERMSVKERLVYLEINSKRDLPKAEEFFCKDIAGSL